MALGRAEFLKNPALELQRVGHQFTPSCQMSFIKYAGFPQIGVQYPQMDGLQWKIQLKMDENWGYPYE